MAHLSAGHDAALNALMDRHGNACSIPGRQLNNDPPRDLAQETFVRVYHIAPDLTPAEVLYLLYTMPQTGPRPLPLAQTHPQFTRRRTRRSGAMLDTLPDGRLSSEQMAAEERATEVRKGTRLSRTLRTPLISPNTKTCPC